MNFFPFYRKTFSQFLILLSVSVITLICLIIYVSYNLSITNEINKFNESLNKITVYSIELKDRTDIFIKSDHTNEFFETETDPKSQEIYNTISLLSESNMQLNELESVETFELTSLINQNMILISDYETSLYMLIQNIIIKGNKEYGYMNSFLYNEEKIVFYLRNYAELLNQFKLLAGIGHYYFNSHGNEYAAQFLKEADELKVRIANQIKSQGATEEISLAYDLFSDYHNTFKQIYNLDKINGVYSGSGLYVDLIDISGELFVNISEMSKKLNHFSEIRSKQFKTGFLVLVFFSSLIYLLSLILLYRIFMKKSILMIEKVSDTVFLDRIEDQSLMKDLFTFVNKRLDDLKDDLKQKEELIRSLIEGDYTKEYNPINANDPIGKGLFELQKSLKIKEQKYHMDIHIRNIKEIQNEGINKFGRILRRNIGNINTLSYELISELVRFMKADIGGIYLKEKEDGIDILMLTASYAFNEKKLIEKKIAFGEGLVGTCAIDKSIFYFDKLDDNYIHIVSGFGFSKPNSLLICPIYVGEEVYGVIELAAIRTFNQEDVDFIKMLTEDIAYTLSYLFSQKYSIKEE